MQKKINLRIRSLFVLVVLSLVITGCPRPVDPVLPTLTTTAASSVTASSSTSGGNIVEEGGAPITDKGICWSTTTGPTIVNNPIKAGNGLGSFTVIFSGLNPGVTYFVRAYATNSAGTAYGNEVTFTTLTILSLITTTPVTNITSSTASSGGNISNDGGGAVSARGVCWGTTTNPTIANNKTPDGTGSGSFASSLTALTPGTKYYVRAYATNSAGTAYGSEISFTTLPNLPTVTTTTATAMTSTAATTGGNVTSDGGATVIARGVCWSTTTNPTITNNPISGGTGTGSFTSSITGLTAGTAYYVRAYATNSAGTAYGSQVSLTTINSYTVAVSSNPTAGGTTSGSGVFNSGSPLTVTAIANTGYIFTDWTESGTVVSTTSVYNFTIIGSRTLVANYTPGVIDADGNVYKTVTIGTQVWFAENLKTTKFSDGALIPLVTGNTAWSNLITPGFCWYNNNENTYKNTYGALYNWYAVNTKKLCPTGWHVPTDDEWTILTNYLGGLAVAGGKLKESGTIHWNSPNTSATNTYGFTALPGGFRITDGTFNSIGTSGYWWSSSEDIWTSNFNYAITSAYYLYMYYSSSDAYGTHGSMRSGFSVRCLRNF